MKRFFAPNLQGAGRWVRGLGAVGLGVGAWFSYGDDLWRQALCAGLGLSALFVLYEALRGWCVLRACGIRTKL